MKYKIEHHRNKKVGEFLDSLAQEHKKRAILAINFIKTEFPEIAKPLFGELLSVDIKEG